MKESKCYKFWEQNFNPITMSLDDDRASRANPLSEGRVQELDERHIKRLRKTEADRSAKILGKFW